MSRSLIGYTGPVEDDEGEGEAVEQVEGEDVGVGTFEQDDLDTADDLMRAMPFADQLTHKAMLRSQKWAAQDRIAPHVRVNPPSANRGTLGGQQRVVMGSAVGVNGLQGKAQVALWTADADMEATAVTVTLCPTQQLRLGTFILPFPALRPYGIIKFGNRAFSVEAEVDIGAGCEFTINASAVSLEVALEQAPPGATLGGTMILSGMLSFQPTECVAPITRTKYLDGIGAGLTDGTQIPAFAKTVSVWREDPAETVTIKFLDYQGGLLYSYILVGGTYLLQPIPLSGDVVFVSVADTGGGGVSHVRLIFQLAL